MRLTRTKNGREMSHLRAKIGPLTLILVFDLMLCGCTGQQNEEPGNRGPAASEKLEIRDNAASLLYELLGDEKNVSKILIIKHNSEELGRVIKVISETAAHNHQELERLAQIDPDLNLLAMRLPPGERAARDAAAKTEEHELLFSSGKEFEFNLLLTQAQALSYGSHLAKVAAEHSSRPDEIQEFNSISRALDNLYQQVVGRMRQG